MNDHYTLCSYASFNSEVSVLWGNHTDNAIGLSHAQIWAGPTHLQYTEFSLLVYGQNIAWMPFRTFVLHPR